MHGYEIKQRLGTSLGPFWTISFGSLYPCLKRLQTSRMVSEVKAPESLMKRRRTTYEITPNGEAFFFEQLEHGAIYDTDRFKLRFAFFRYLPPKARIGLMERRRAYLEEKLEEFAENLKATGNRLDAYSKSLVRHQTEATQQDIRWLTELIADERSTRARRSK